MVHLLASIANDPEYMPALLHALRPETRLPEEPASDETWGVGYFEDRRGLIVRKPASLLEERSAFSVAGDLRSGILMVSVRSERDRLNAPPFRFRQWLFGYAGKLEGVGALQSTIAPKLPNFVGDVLGDGDGGRLAHAMFLAELHRASLLEDPLAEASALGAALERTAEALVRLAPEAGVDTLDASFMASNGRAMLVTRAGRPLLMREVSGLENLPDGPVDETLHDFKRVAESLRRFRARVVTNQVDPDRRGLWTELPERGTTVIESGLDLLHL